MKSKCRYAELVGSLKTTENALNTTQIPVKCEWTGNISLSINNFTFTPSTQECNGKGYSHNCKETRMTTNSTQRHIGKDYFPNLKEVGMNPSPPPKKKLANYCRLHSSVTGQPVINSRFHQLQPCTRHLKYIFCFLFNAYVITTEQMSACLKYTQHKITFLYCRFLKCIQGAFMPHNISEVWPLKKFSPYLSPTNHRCFRTCYAKHAWQSCTSNFHSQ